jgi:putative cell wall-binding protein
MRIRTLFASVAATMLAAVGTVGAAQASTHSSAAAATITRYSGADRFATSAAIVDATYKPGVPVVYIATGLNFPDALAGGAAAAEAGGPLLLVEPTLIPPVIATELTRLTPGRIVILGGLASVSAGVQTALQAYTTGTVTRVAGIDRYATAAALAATFPAGSPVYLATGLNFPDALAATAAAAAKHAAILLTDPLVLPTTTATALTTLKPSSITVVGSTAAVSASIETELAGYSGTVTRLSGVDRYATAAAIAQAAFPTATGVFIASGGGFADALTGGPIAGTLGEPLLLAAATCLPSETASEVTALAPTTVTLLGGTSALSAGVATLTSCVVRAPLPSTEADAPAS